jgi:hypothetical protein
MLGGRVGSLFLGPGKWGECGSGMPGMPGIVRLLRILTTWEGSTVPEAGFSDTQVPGRIAMRQGSWKVVGS